MATDNPFPLNIEEKEDSWSRVQLLSSTGAQFKLPASEFNKIIKAIQFNYENIGGLPFTGTPPVRTFQTLDQLLAFGPVPEEGTPAKVSNDPTASNNGFYSVSGGEWVKDSSLFIGEIQDGEVEAVTGDKIFTAIESNNNNYESFVNVFPDNKFIEGLWNKISGDGNVTYVDYNGKRAVRISNCIAEIKIDFSEYVNTDKKWSFAVFVESLILGSLNTRFIAQCLNTSNGLEGDRFNLYQSNNLTGKFIFSDNYSFHEDAVKFQIYIDATGDDIYLSNFFIGNAPYAKYVPKNQALFNSNSNFQEIEITKQNLAKRALYNAIPNNIYSNGLKGWENMPAGVNSSSAVISVEDVSNPFNSKVRRSLAGAVGSNNFSGIAINIEGNFSVGDTVVFKGLIKKSLNTDNPYIELRAKDASLATLETTVSSNYTENSTDWIETGELTLTLPENTVWVFVFIRDWTQSEFIDMVGWTLTKSISNLESQYIINEKFKETATNDGRYSYYVSKLGDDANDGSSDNPLLTIQQAIENSLGKGSVKINILEGDYREELDFSALRDENIEFISKETEVVRVLGSDKLEGFVKTTGYSNIYEASFNGSIIDYPNNMGKVIFEDGNYSKEIPSNEHNALQKGLSKRLPYTEIKEQVFDTDLSTTLSLLDNNSSKFYHDEANNKIYIHTTNSDNPTANEFSYEVSVRSTTFSTTLPTEVNYRFLNIQFCYSNISGFDVRKAKSVYRNKCCAFGNNGNGFKDDVTTTISHKDEAAGNSNDGINGHYDVISGFASTNLRSGYSSSVYFNPWVHDNYDDGISFHERGDYHVFGGLTEYNGDRGCVPASGSNLTAHGVIARKNGFNVGIISNTYGEGFSIVNDAIDGRVGTNATLINCISEENNKGYAVRNSTNNKMVIINCISRNNNSSELDASEGVIISKNTLASTNSVLKSTSNGGVITVENDSILN